MIVDYILRYSPAPNFDNSRFILSVYLEGSIYKVCAGSLFLVSSHYYFLFFSFEVLLIFFHIPYIIFHDLMLSRISGNGFHLSYIFVSKYFFNQ